MPRTSSQSDLDSVDHNLRNSGFAHLRYVDDIRVFCRDLQQAKRAMLCLSDLLRARGLNIQSAKTKIHRRDEALLVIDGVGSVIQRINEELREELRAFVDTEYGTIAELEAVMAENPDSPPLAVLERGFRSYFIDASDSEFDKTLFHYLLTRLGAIGSPIGVDYCIAALSKRPEETEYILRYIGKLSVDDQIDSKIIEYLYTPEAIYDYQIFLVLRTIFRPSSILRPISRILSISGEAS